MMSWNKKNDILALMVGHGTQLNGIWDSGCTYKSYTEAGLMLEIVKVAVNLLRKSGIRVLTDADEGNNRNMKSSVAWANNKKAKLYMSVHCDYYKATAGVAPLYISSTGKAFAVAVGKSIAKLVGMKWKGAFKRTDLYELNATNMPAVILETGAIKADLKYLKDAKKYGKALAKAICIYVGVEYCSVAKEATKKTATAAKKTNTIKKTNAQKIADTATELAYATAAKDKAQYPKGKPKDEYKTALNKAYPDRKKWGTPSKKGASCDVYAGTVIRVSGVDPKFPRCLNQDYDYLEKSKKFKRVKVKTAKDLQDGDIIIYRRPNKKGHICIYVGGKIKHAAWNKWYPRTQKCVKKMLSTKNKQFVRVYRAK